MSALSPSWVNAGMVRGISGEATMRYEKSLHLLTSGCPLLERCLNLQEVYCLLITFHFKKWSDLLLLQGGFPCLLSCKNRIFWLNP